MDDKHCFRQVTLDNFDKILLSMLEEENKTKELFFASEMIDSLCKQSHVITYRFAHNLEGEIYTRMRMRQITVEYLVNPRISPQDYNAKLLRIYIQGQLSYHNPNTPEGKIYLVWSN